MGGPPPIPNERKRRRGNPGKRPLPKPSSVTAVPALTEVSAVPDHLGPAGSWLWETVTTYADHWLAPSDEPLVRMVCEAADRRARLVARLEADGEVLFTEKGYAYQHPAVGMVSTLDAQVTKWLSLLGLSPTDRTRMGLVEVKAASTLDQLRKNRQEKP